MLYPRHTFTTELSPSDVAQLLKSYATRLMSLALTLGFGYARYVYGGTWRGTVAQDSFKVCYIKNGFFVGGHILPVIHGSITAGVNGGSDIHIIVRMPWFYYVMLSVMLIFALSLFSISASHLWQGAAFAVLFVVVAMIHVYYDLTRAKRRFVELLDH